MQSNREWATIGKIVAPFGIRGELKVLSMSDVPQRFANLDAVYLSSNYQRYTLEKIRPHKGDMLVLKLEGIDDVNQAEAVRNSELLLPLEQLAQLPPDSYYQHDILNLQVLTLAGRLVGSIVEIISTGSNDVYVVKESSGQQVLIPAIKDVVKQVDLVGRVMYIDPMPGLLDEAAVIDESGIEITDKEENER